MLIEKCPITNIDISCSFDKAYKLPKLLNSNSIGHVFEFEFEFEFEFRALMRRKRRWIGHVLRHENLLQTALEGRMEGKRPRGRRRFMMVTDLKNGEGYAEMQIRAEDQEKGRKMA